MTLDWTIAEEKNSPCSKDNLTACTDVNIFFDKFVSLLLIAYNLKNFHPY